MLPSLNMHQAKLKKIDSNSDVIDLPTQMMQVLEEEDNTFQ